MSTEKSDGGGVKNCGSCYWRNPSSDYCPKSGVEREDNDPACGCYANYEYPKSFPTHIEHPMPRLSVSEVLKDYIMEKKETKVCTRCGREMPLESFPKSIRSKDGYMSVCKECNSKARSEGRWGKKTVHVEEVTSWPATPAPEQTQKPGDAIVEKILKQRAAEAEEELQQNVLKATPDKTLVEELRSRGWEVTCKRTIVEEL